MTPTRTRTPWRGSLFSLLLFGPAIILFLKGRVEVIPGHFPLPGSSPAVAPAPAASPEAAPGPGAPAASPAPDVSPTPHPTTSPDAPASPAPAAVAPTPSPTPSPESSPAVPSSPPASSPVPPPVPGEGATGSSSGTGQVHGLVVDAQAHSPVGQTEVLIPELKMETFTNHKGEFSLKGIPARDKPYELMIVRPGYENAYLELAIPAGNTYEVRYEIRRKGFK